MGRATRPPSGVPLREIADAVGVSVSTVSRALNGSERVSELTKQAVRDAVAELRSRQARGGGGAAHGAVKAPPMLGVTHSHLSSGPWTRALDNIVNQVLVGIEIACLQAGYIPYIWQQSRLLTEGKGEPFFKAVSGAIVAGGLVERTLLDHIRARGLPVVIVGGHLPGEPVPSVAADSQRGMYIATRHLLDLGHRRIALVNGPPETYTSAEKLAGYLTALFEGGVVADPALVGARSGYTGFDAPAAEALTEAVLALPAPPTAIVYAADLMADVGYRVCQRHGLRIPADISIVGFHDDPEARHAHPPMTTVRVDRNLWGQLATDILVATIAGEPLRGSRLLTPVELVVRASTGPAPER